MTRDRLRADRRLERNQQRRRAGSATHDVLRACLVVAAQAPLPIGDRREHGAQVAVLGAAEFLAAIDDPDIVLLAQSERILDGGIAGAEHQYGLVAEFLRIVDLVLLFVALLAGHAQTTRIALETDGEPPGRG